MSRYHSVVLVKIDETGSHDRAKINTLLSHVSYTCLLNTSAKNSYCQQINCEIGNNANSLSSVDHTSGIYTHQSVIEQIISFTLRCATVL